jgi:hypothetical protein
MLLAEGAFWTSPFGKTLGLKLGSVGLVAIMSLVHARDARRSSRATRLGRLVLPSSSSSQ